MTRPDIDIAILGGGLAGGLIALTLAEKRPDIALMLVESGDTFGGNHVWSSFASDVTEQDSWLIEPLIAARWSGYSVHFPSHSRVLPGSYRSITSERLDARLRAVLPENARMTDADVASCDMAGFTLSDGRVFEAGAVIDARGTSVMPHMAGGWQKFTGQMLQLKNPHGLERPIVMDARVQQIDGYRFVYSLPFSATEVFVEDTYYSDSSQLDMPAMRNRIAEYAGQQGWQIAAIAREESGVLPVIAKGDFTAFWNANVPNVAKAGARAALVHPLTSYSLPDAVRFARYIGQQGNLSGAALADASYAFAHAHWKEGRFYRLLTTMLFSAALPPERYRILQRFYRLPEGLIERFYGGRTTTADAFRILAGRPPVPIGAAIASLAGCGRPLAPLNGDA